MRPAPSNGPKFPTGGTGTQYKLAKGEPGVMSRRAGRIPAQIARVPWMFEAMSGAWKFLSATPEVAAYLWEKHPSTQTTMPNRSLPPEIPDHIVGFLHDNKELLSQCCLVSKLWVPRVRKHIFAVVKFRTLDDIDAWKKTFPDPFNSPAHYTRTLSISCFEVVTAADAAEGGWIPTFSRLLSLDLDDGQKCLPAPLGTSFAPFCKFSPTLKSLNVTSFILPLSQVFSLIHSLSLLEDLALVGIGTVIDDNERGGPQTVVSSSVPSKLTGTLEIFLFSGVAVTLRPLLHLPNGIHFRTIKLSQCKNDEDLRYLVELVAACSDTLENLSVAYKPEGVVYSVYFLTQSLT